MRCNHPTDPESDVLSRVRLFLKIAYAAPGRSTSRLPVRCAASLLPQSATPVLARVLALLVSRRRLRHRARCLLDSPHGAPARLRHHRSTSPGSPRWASTTTSPPTASASRSSCSPASPPSPAFSSPGTSRTAPTNSSPSTSRSSAASTASSSASISSCSSSSTKSPSSPSTSSSPSGARPAANTAR